MLILRLQTQLVDLNKDFTINQRELEQNKSQLNSYIASVKTFWSPELKKERALRKEETQKYQKSQEICSAAQHEKQVGPGPGSEAHFPRDHSHVSIPSHITIY